MDGWWSFITVKMMAFLAGEIQAGNEKPANWDSKKKRVKISPKLIRNFKQAYDEIDAKIFGNPFSLLSLKTPDFVEAFNRSFSTFLVGNFPAKNLQVVSVKRPKTLVGSSVN